MKTPGLVYKQYRIEYNNSQRLLQVSGFVITKVKIPKIITPNDLCHRKARNPIIKTVKIREYYYCLAISALKITVMVIKQPIIIMYDYILIGTAILR